MISQVSSVSILVYTVLCVESWSTNSWGCGSKTGELLRDIIGCVKYHCLQCKCQFVRSGQISEFNFRPSKCRPCTVPPGADAPFPPPLTPTLQTTDVRQADL